jgi:hypothetical protein
MPSPFDARADAELGAALRVALTVGDDAAFVARVLAAAAAPRPRTLDVLAGWARGGIAAAVAAAALVAILIARAPGSDAGTLDEAYAAAVGSGTPAVLASSQAPDPSELFATLGGR